jgi:hypothetical protein
VAANTARDVGGRLAAIAIWGTRANGGRYAAIAALTNIPATVSAYAFYEFFLKDSSRGAWLVIINHAFLGLDIYAVLVLTVIGKECHDSRTAYLEHRGHDLNNNNITISYGSGPDSEMGKNLQK